MHIVYISSFVPRKCGIATYTRDLSESVDTFGDRTSVIAMEHPTMNIAYPQNVIGIIRQQVLSDYKKVAQALASSQVDVIHLQHEFGLFGGENGEYILDFAKRIKKPLVVTFHTILLTPNEKQKYIVKKLAQRCQVVVVMNKVARKRLKSVYGIDERKVVVIRHGAPDIRLSSDVAKKRLKLTGRFILFANNLLSREKGMEYAVKAIAKIHKKIPSILFIMAGETHPIVKNFEGESYREELVRIVKKHHLELNVLFKNKYLTTKELKIYLAAADIYITPYLDPQQITSGTLSYAIGAKKPAIATKYIYAKTLLGRGRGVLVPFRNSDAIAKSLMDLYKNPQKQREIQQKLEKISEEMSWFYVARKHTQVYSLLEGKITRFPYFLKSIYSFFFALF